MFYDTKLVCGWKFMIHISVKLIYEDSLLRNKCFTQWNKRQ